MDGHSVCLQTTLTSPSRLVRALTTVWLATSVFGVGASLIGAHTSRQVTGLYCDWLKSHAVTNQRCREACTRPQAPTCHTCPVVRADNVYVCECSSYFEVVSET